MIRQLLTLTLILILPLTASAESPAPQSAEQKQYRAGEDYIVIDNPVRTRNKDKIEVTEVFWYGCPHCYSFQPLTHAWEQRLPEDIDYRQSPAIWNAPMELHARAFYTAQALGVADKLHQPLFTTLVVERRPLNNEKQIENLFADYGVDREAFRQTFHSFGVDSQVKQADARARNYGIGGTPEIIVNGKYRVSARTAGGQKEMLDVVDYLVEQERANQVHQDGEDNDDQDDKDDKEDNDKSD